MNDQKQIPETFEAFANALAKAARDIERKPLDLDELVACVYLAGKFHVRVIGFLGRFFVDALVAESGGARIANQAARTCAQQSLRVSEITRGVIPFIGAINHNQAMRAQRWALTASDALGWNARVTKSGGAS